MRITRNPEAYRTLLGVFETVDDATNTISDIIGAGIVPGGAGDARPPDPAGGGGGVSFRLPARRRGRADHGGRRPRSRARRRGRAHRRDRHARTRPARCAGPTREAERLLLWKCRKQAFGAVGRLAPSYCTQDGVVPRTKLPHILRVIQAHRREVPAPDRQRLPRRRRQHPPDPALRRTRPRPGEARAGGQPRDPGRVHRAAAAASPASTASASRRSTSCPSCSRRKTWP